jgi:hypothetical protein
MPRIEISGELVAIADCPVCDRTVLCENRLAAGFVAPCGRRLINLSECGKALHLCSDRAREREPA